ncbi:MAG: outer membrane protein transport protein [Kofleriaceae bacterium]|nr:outer membrane protein transport protein [Myxococcales bacterium]MCB9564879.1 outer membrane protein transport protein [Kofleriaceae bacterium]MCB9573541.1 outer membrane protein transport protein [Kofleriaceae bacterium]
MKHRSSGRGAALAAAALVLAPATAWAGGMTLHTRGVRPTARGGAFVAGADDVGAMWFNPAGLAHLAGTPDGVDDDDRGSTEVLVDATFVQQSGEYDRIDSGGNPQGTVSNEAAGLPIPTMAAGFDLGDQGVLAVGVGAPFAGLMKFPEDGAQRYSLVDMSQSLIVQLMVGVGWKLGDHIRIGATVQDWVQSLTQRVVVSGCPGQTLCAPENPEFDSLVEVSQNDFFNPSGSLGVQLDAGDKVTFGAAFQAPIKMSGGATLRTRLPSSGFYQGASVVGEDATVSYTLPATMRLAVEIKPTPQWRVELAGDVELWSEHKEIRIVPKDVRIENAAGVGTYELGPMAVPRNFDNSYAVSLGVEGQPVKLLPLRILAGYTFETAAAPDAYLSVLTFDGQKHMGTLGAGYRIGRYTFDAMVGVVKVADRTVTPDVGVSPQLTPVRDPTDEPLEVYVNWGTYRTSWLMAGAGVRVDL